MRVDRAQAGIGPSMLFVPEQRRPPLTRRRERYATTTDLTLAMAVEQVVGWEIAQAIRLPDGSVEAVFVR